MKRILITRARLQSEDFAEKLRFAGFEPIFFPVIEIQPIENNVALERALSKLDCYGRLVFTSVNAVHVVFDYLGTATETQRHAGSVVSLSQGDTMANPRIAAIGPKTAEALRARGVNPDFVPEEYLPESILRELGDMRGKWILLPRAEIALKALPEAIAEAGGVPHEVAVYKTLPVEPDPQGLAALKSGVDVVTLTSPSTVQNFIAIARQHELDPLALPGNPLFACIGPTTEQAAREEGLVNLVTAKEYTTDGLIDLISNMEVS
jgi:uroporphyrinogen III methyltransferase/synthase